MQEERDHDRWATSRARYISRATDLRKNEAEAIAYTEQGYSWRTVGQMMDTSKSTAKGWIERAMAQYGLEIAETLSPEEFEPPLSKPTYEPVGSTYLDELKTQQDRERWAECVQRHREKLPQEWVNEVVPELERQGYFSVNE